MEYIAGRSIELLHRINYGILVMKKFHFFITYLTLPAYFLHHHYIRKKYILKEPPYGNHANQYI